MGNVLSSAPSGERTADHVTSESETMEESVSSDKESENEVFHDTIDEDEARAKAKEEEMEEFRQQLQIKREQRKEILARHRSEKEALEKSLEMEIKAKLEAYQTNRQLRELLERNYIDIPEELDSSKENSDIASTIVQMTEEFERLKASNNKLRVGLAETNNTLQAAYSDIADLTEQNRESVKQINALREVISVSKTMIGLREEQLNELKNKLHEIERSLADREANMLSADLRQEYERQLLNIRTLRSLYEERARLAEVTRQSLVRDLEEQKLLKEAEIIKNKDLTTKVEDLEIKVEDLQETIQSKNNQIFVCQEESRGLQAEMTVVNKLFSQVLLGYKTKQDLDKLVHRLEENHGLLTHMAEKENGSEASSALPKLLLELVSQIDEGEENKELDGEANSSVEEKSVEPEKQTAQNTSAEEIVENLPKVWRVLMELLSHQSSTEENPSEKVTTCYKSVETNSGPVLVPSVSQTYIRLKDLILEKLALIKEVNRMKQLNVHLETRLGEQERRLCLVTTELGKTWHVVGRLRRHHHQLHTHEKILKYELQQKRKLLNELKEELEYCREKWEQAREKNTQTEKDWRKLRAEFSSRKTNSSSCNNSAESGYSDERPSDDSSESNDESECVTEPLIKSKKKFKKSFETILDSSTDINLAEREDPASDLIDVADLPLDTQDGDDNHEASVTDSCSENINKSEKMCETEDEVGDIIDDSCAEETATTSCPSREDSQNKDMGKRNKDNESSSSTSSEVVTSVVPVIDLAGILESIKKQNERLALKDKKLERLEKSGAALLKQTKTTAKISEQINSTLDHLLNRPTSSSSRQSNNLETTSITDMEEVILQESNAIQENTVEDNDKNNLNAEQSINTELNVKDVITENVSKTNIGNEKRIEVSPTLNSEMACTDKADNVTQTSTGDLTLKLGDDDRKSQHKEKDCTDLLVNTTANSTNEKVIVKMYIKNQQDGSGNECSETTVDNSTSNKNKSVPSASSGAAFDANVAPEINLAAIRKSIKEQNERLAIRDKKLETLEKGGAALLKQAQTTVKTSEQINNILDHLLERPSISSRQTSDLETTLEKENLQECTEEPVAHDIMLNKDEVNIEDSEHGIIEVIDQSTINADDDNSECISAAETTETINKRDDIIHKQDDNAACSGNEISEASEKSNTSTREGSEQSSSSEIDHEARFAARDLRFKRLEEQTKSLVNKVNKTNSKGVKIHYKLEELHNIYRSQNSRAGTPSEDSDRSQNEEDTREHEERE